MTTNNNDRRSEFPAGEDREKIEREMAEREALLKREETLRWAYERQAARGAVTTPDTITKRFPSREEVLRETQHESQPASLTREWATYIKQQIDRQERCTMRAVAQVVVEEERQREALGERVKALEADLAELRDRLDQGKRLRAMGD
jgi:hypothetical protein